MKFNLNLLELSFLGKDLYKVPIYYYPMLILEFMDGNYTTTELFQKNEDLKKGDINLDSYEIVLEENTNLGNMIGSINDVDEVIIEDKNNTNNQDEKKIKTMGDRTSSVNNFNPNLAKNLELFDKDNDKNKKNGRASSIFDFEEIEKPQELLKEQNNILRNSLQNTTSKLIKDNKKENKKEKLLKKMKTKKKGKRLSKEFKEKKIECYIFGEYFNLYLEKILYFRDEINRKGSIQITVEDQTNQIEDYKNIIELYKRKERMKQVKAQIEFYKNKDKEINNIKQKIHLILSNKKLLLNKLNEKIKSYKIKYTELKTNYKNLVPIVAKKQLIYDSFLNKKMAEICFVFFNNKIKSLYLIPDFLQNSIKNDNNEFLKKRFEFYNNNKKKLSSMMGYITQLMIYMSKCFDIPLRYPLMLNGAKSFIIRGKKDKEKDFLPLHFDLKRDDKHGNFETGLNYLKDDFKEIIDFCSMYPEIISKDKYNKFNKCNDDYLFFYYFINFNHCLCDFIKNIQKMFE